MCISAYDYDAQLNILIICPLLYEYYFVPFWRLSFCNIHDANIQNILKDIILLFIDIVICIWFIIVLLQWKRYANATIYMFLVSFKTLVFSILYIWFYLVLKQNFALFVILFQVSIKSKLHLLAGIHPCIDRVMHHLTNCLIFLKYWL